MGLINSLKVAAIKAADFVNAHHDPFEPFTRPAQPKFPETLATKAALFEKDLADFAIRGGTIYQYRIPIPVGSPLDLGDQALHHGLATAMWAFKGDYEKIAFFLVGLRDQQPNGRLIRGIDEKGNTMEDASNDQATGHLLGLWAAWFYGNPAQRIMASTLTDIWTSNVLANGHALVNPDGKPTTYGALIQGWRTDPLRLTLCLAIYCVAYAMTGNTKYRTAYQEIGTKYLDLIPYPKVKFLWWDTNYDTHRAAIHLMLLAKHGPFSIEARDGLLRLRFLVSKEGNIWINALCAMGLEEKTLDDREMALKVLSEFTLADKQYNTGKVNSDDANVEKTIWNDEWVSRQPLPRWRVSAQDNFWTRNLYAIDFRNQGDPADSRYNGMDFLTAYYLCRKLGILNEND